MEAVPTIAGIALSQRSGSGAQRVCRGPLQRFRFVAFEGRHDGRGRTREGDVSVPAEVLLEDAGGRPLFDDGVGPGVEPGRGASHLAAPPVQQPEAVALAGEADRLDGLVRLFQHGPDDRAERLHRLVDILLRALGTRVVQLYPTSLGREDLPVQGEGGGLHDRGTEVYTKYHRRIILPSPPG
ncbi:MAG: hypothetical protein WKF95_00715 [Rubrobacter sp.]